MAQIKESRARGDSTVHLLPTASVDITSGDVVVAARKHDPISRSQLGTPGAVRPIASAHHGRWVVGVCDQTFTTTVVGATEYATPTASLRIQREGVFRLSIVSTSGKAGDYVRYSSGATGAQLFDIDNLQVGRALGVIERDFSGASANDLQYVRLLKQPLDGPSIYHYLENRVIEGCNVLLHAAPGSQIKVGHNTGTVVQKNLVVIQNALKSIAQDVTLAFGGVASAASSTIRFKWVVARSASFAIRSASGSKAALASYTVAGVTAGLFVPVTMTAGEIPIALLIQFSAATQSAARIKNVRGPGYIPRVGSWGV